MALARVDAGGHAQLDGPHRALGAADRLDRPLHVRGRPGRPRRVPVAVEEEEQRVAAELEHVAAVPLGDLDQAVEADRDPLDELLGAGLALRRQPLGQCREAGDVHGDERAFELAHARAVALVAPAADEARQVGRQQRVARLRRARLGLSHGLHVTIMGQQSEISL